jgi:hypothetical protein
MLLDPETRPVLALVVLSGLFTSEHVAPYGDIQTLGRDAAIARSGTGVLGPKEWCAQAVDVARSSALRHKRVPTTRGRGLGEVHEVVLDDGGTWKASKSQAAA